MRNGWLAAVAITAVATVPACSEADREQIKHHASQVIAEAEEAAEAVIDQADEAVDTMDDMADKLMFSHSAHSPAAVAALSPVGGSGVRGRIRFSKSIHGLEVRATVSGLSPGEHAVHIHPDNDCSTARVAGPARNQSIDSADARYRNLGEFTSADNGTDIELTVLHVPLSRIMGKAVVVHADGNAPAHPPADAAGVRVACGVIQPASGTGNVPAPANTEH